MEMPDQFYDDLAAWLRTGRSLPHADRDAAKKFWQTARTDPTISDDRLLDLLQEVVQVSEARVALNESKDAAAAQNLRADLESLPTPELRPRMGRPLSQRARREDRPESFLRKTLHHPLIYFLVFVAFVVGTTARYGLGGAAAWGLVAAAGAWLLTGLLP
jgi:hypothetical protein